MKTAQQWVEENSQSGAFDLVDSIKDAEELVKQIQADANQLKWIPITEQKPPSINETPETDGFFLLLRKDESIDSHSKKRMHKWFGSVPINATHWAKIPAFK